MKYEKNELITKEVEIDLHFPFYMAMHRKWTYAKFELKYYLHEPSAIECVYITYVQMGFNIDTFIKKQRLYVPLNVLSVQFKNIYDAFEHTVTKEEYDTFFVSVLEELKLEL